MHVMIFHTNIHCPQMMNPNDFGDCHFCHSATMRSAFCFVNYQSTVIECIVLKCSSDIPDPQRKNPIYFSESISFPMAPHKLGIVFTEVSQFALPRHFILTFIALRR